MVETRVRHPKLFAFLAGALALVGAVALIGPRDGGPVGVDGASATSPDSSVQPDSSAPADTAPPNTPTSDDGVVLTAPGELVDVFVPPSTSADVDATGSAPATTTAPSVTSAPESASGSGGSPVTTTAAPGGPVEDGEPSDTGEGDDAPPSTIPPTTDMPATTLRDDDPVAASGDDATPATTEIDGVVENTSAISSQSTAGALLLAAPELSGTANGTTIEGPNLVGQLGTRDSSSVPWMLMISANFAVMVGALVFLRLRR